MKHHFLISFMILTFATCTLTGCGAKEIHQVSVIDEKYVHPIGRTLAEKKDNQDKLYFANSCSGFAFQATMKEDVHLKFSLYGNTTSTYSAQYAKVVVDQELLEVLQIQNGVNDYILQNAITKGKHEIQLLKMNEPAFSNMGLLKIYEDNFVFEEYVTTKTKKIEFYGDSITCGYGNLTDNTQSFSMETEDGTKAYTQLCADALGFENSVVSYSGISMALSPFNSDFTMLDRYQTVDSSKAWDFSRYVPDVIVINIGTNDNTKLRTLSGNAQIDGLNQFYENLKQMVLDLKTKAPQAKFVFAYNMMLPISDGLVTCMESVKRELDKENENTAYLLEFTPEGKGADGHPSLEGHKQSAEQLKSFIETIL